MKIPEGHFERESLAIKAVAILFDELIKNKKDGVNSSAIETAIKTAQQIAYSFLHQNSCLQKLVNKFRTRQFFAWVRRAHGQAEAQYSQAKKSVLLKRTSEELDHIVWLYVEIYQKYFLSWNDSKRASAYVLTSGLPLLFSELCNIVSTKKKAKEILVKFERTLNGYCSIEVSVSETEALTKRIEYERQNKSNGPTYFTADLMKPLVDFVSENLMAIRHRKK